MEKEKVPFKVDQSEEVVKTVRARIYKDFIMCVDANDNGIDKVNGKDVNGVPTTLWARVAKTNPMWWDETADQMALFR